MSCALGTLLLAAWAASGASTAPPAGPARLAVIVGANKAAAGRAPLRFSYLDARQMADVLTRAGDFLAGDVQVLEDPAPEQVLAALDAKLAKAAGREALLVFYYSGHADTAALYPNGKPLPLTALRERLDDPRATVRVGIIDACRGGGWTGAKGLTSEAPFEVGLPLGLANEGSVLLASSSGVENAHESESLQGSFFTHHMVGGLSGAADVSGDGEVTIGEAFDYARQHTIRDSALQAETPQHPSFDMNLRGRADMPLTRVATADSGLTVAQSTGPLQLVQLSSGVVVLESPAGPRTLRLAVAPGRYVLRRRVPQGMYAHEFDVRAGQTVLAREESLELVGNAALSAKRFAEPPPDTFTTLPRGSWLLRPMLGVTYGTRPQGVGFSDPGFDSSVATRKFDLTFLTMLGITDRLQWALPLPAVAYRFGEPGGTEVVPWLGMTSVGLGYSSVEGTMFSYGLGVGIGVRQWLGPNNALNVTAGTWTQGAVSSLQKVNPDSFDAELGLGYSHRIAEVVTVNLGVSLAAGLSEKGRARLHNLELRLGSIQELGMRPLPLIQVHVMDKLSVDGHVGIAIDWEKGAVRDSYLIGVTKTF
ncbi:MAG: caspase family protein [Myxococcales bacterium]